MPSFRSQEPQLGQPAYYGHLLPQACLGSYVTINEKLAKWLTDENAELACTPQAVCFVVEGVTKLAGRSQVGHVPCISLMSHVKSANLQHAVCPFAFQAG